MVESFIRDYVGALLGKTRVPGMFWTPIHRLNYALLLPPVTGALGVIGLSSRAPNT